MADTEIPSIEEYILVESDDEEEEEEEEVEVEEEEDEAIDDALLEKMMKRHSGPFMPRSPPDLSGLSEGEIEAILQRFSDDEMEDLFNKNTQSFRCLAQALVSRSSIFRQVLYHFPELTDPGIDEACEYVEPDPQFDNVGIEKYKAICKDMNIGPISRVIRSLQRETLNLKYYSLNDKQWKSIASSLMLNTFVKNLILQDNWLSPSAALWLGELLQENNTIKVLNLRECRLGIDGIKKCVDGLGVSQSLRELDLSYNDLEDEGVKYLVEALKENYNIEKLNIGHNNLGEASCLLLSEWLKGPNKIDYLDVSWNNFGEGKAMKYLCDSLINSATLQYLNLSWNGIRTPKSLLPLVKYLKNNPVIEHLDLSFNRIMGPLVPMIRAGIAGSQLKSINLGFNLLTPDDAILLASIFNPEKPLEFMDLQNVFVNKQFVPIWQKLDEMGKSVRIEGIISNYTIQGPDKTKVIFNRCKYLAQKPKKPKLRRDFGSDFIWNLPDKIVELPELKKMVKKTKIKLDGDLLAILGETFQQKKKKIDLKLMRDAYLALYPDTQPPVIPEKKKKKNKKGKRGKSKVRPKTEEKGIGTDSLLVTSSSLVTSQMPIQDKSKTFSKAAVESKTFSTAAVGSKTFSTAAVGSKTFSTAAVGSKTFSKAAVGSKTFSTAVVGDKTLSTAVVGDKTLSTAVVGDKTLSTAVVDSEKVLSTSNLEKSISRIKKSQYQSTGVISRASNFSYGSPTQKTSFHTTSKVTNKKSKSKVKIAFDLEPSQIDNAED